MRQNDSVLRCAKSWTVRFYNPRLQAWPASAFVALANVFGALHKVNRRIEIEQSTWYAARTLRFN